MPDIVYGREYEGEIKSMQDCRELRKEELKNKIIEKIGNEAFQKIDRIYETVMRLFGVKKEMPFRVRIGFELHNRVRKKGRKNALILKKGRYRDNSFTISGDHNLIQIGEGCAVTNVKFEIYGSNNSIVIGDRVILRDALIHLGDNGSSMKIGDDTGIGIGFHVSILEGASVTIGNDCMFSWNTSLMNSDSHSIIDLETDCRINEASDIFIGNHVWFGQDVTVLKGARILDNTVIGNRSMVTKGNYEGNSIYVGTPARLLRGGGTMVA